MYLGFDLGGSTIRGALFNRNFATLTQTKRILRTRGTGYTKITDSQVVHAIIETTFEMLQKSLARPTDIQAIGIGFPGPVAANFLSTLGSPNISTNDNPMHISIAAAFSEIGLHLPIRFFNDVAAQLWAERTKGSVQGIDDVLAIYLGTGLGGAIISSGVLVHGTHGRAGEIGHLNVPGNTKSCGCGKQGCLETIVGGPHLQSDGNCAVKIGMENKVLDLPALDCLYKQLLELTNLWDRSANLLATQIANMCILLDPAALIFGGGVFRMCPNFLNTLEVAVRRLTQSSSIDTLSFHHASLGDTSGCLGAVLLACECTVRQSYDSTRLR